MQRADKVPIAAPTTPSFGAPKSPKIRMAFTTIFKSKELAYTTVEITTFSILFSKLR